MIVATASRRPHISKVRGTGMWICRTCYGAAYGASPWIAYNRWLLTVLGKLH